MSDEEWDGSGRRESERDTWDGEDEEDDVKDAWDKSDDEEEKKGDEDNPEMKAVQKKKKKKLADILAEKEAAKLLEQERLREEALATTPEAKLAEKMRLQKLEENANLQLAKDMMGIKSSSIDSMVPVNKEDFEKFNKALHEKISSLASSDHYNDFLEAFIKNLCSDLQVSTATLKRIKMNVEALHGARLKAEKEAAARNKKLQKAGKAAGIRMDTNKDIFSADAGASRYDDMDDFM